MYPHKAHLPPGLLTKLKQEQQQLRNKIILQKFEKSIGIIAGCDSAFIEGDKILSVFVVFSFPGLEEIEVQWQVSEVTLPYIPGYLGFREIPNLLNTYQKIKNIPDIIMVDGHGIAHPRRLGIATHLGVTINVPTIGVAKKRLAGIFTTPALAKGSYTNITDQGEVVGVALRSKDNTLPVFVSPGHLCDVDSALALTLKCLKKHKLPEPTRIADFYSKRYKPLASVGV